MGKKYIRMVSGILTALILFSSVFVFADDSASVKSFSDISETDWFYSYVDALTKSGAVSGYPDGSFKPAGEITCAEYTKILLTALGFEIVSNTEEPKKSVSEDTAETLSEGSDTTTASETAEPEKTDEISSSEETVTAEDTASADDTNTDSKPPEEVTAEDTNPPVSDNPEEAVPETETDVKPEYTHPQPHWAQSYIDTAVREGILTPEDDLEYEPDKPVTRNLMIKMMIRALGIEPILLTEEDFPFVDTTDEYASAAWINYLLSGYIEDGVRYFRGENSTTRAEACAIVVRACEYTDNPEEFKEIELIKYASLNPVNTKIELINYFCYINKKFSNAVTLNSKMSYDEWTEVYEIAAAIYPEYIMSRGYDCMYYRNSNYFDLKFIYEADHDTMIRIAEEADADAEAAARLIRMTTTDVYEQIKMAHDYIIEKCDYDYENYVNGTLPYEAYTAYGALIKKSAVCQGYSAAFNLICKKLGIESYSVTGTSPDGTSLESDFHMWNIVRIDGLQYFVDLTYDDPVNSDGTHTIEYDSFMLTMQQFKANGYTWTDNAVNDIYYKLLY